MGNIYVTIGQITRPQKEARREEEMNSMEEKITAIEAANKELGFVAGCDVQVARFAAVLAHSVGGDWLELGTGTGLSTLFLGNMLGGGRLDSVDNDAKASNAAKQIIGTDKNINFIVEDGGTFLKACPPESYRFIFADAWPGKFSHLHFALQTLGVGGLYVIDDLLPQANWPPNHQPRVDMLLAFFEETDAFAMSYLDWASGVAIVTKLERVGAEKVPVKKEDYAFLFSEEVAF